MMKLGLGLVPRRLSQPIALLALAGLAGAAFACGDMSASAFDGTGGPSSSESGDGGRGGDLAPAPGTALQPVDNAVILVHAAKSMAFRLCFGGDKELDGRPQPDSQVMPEANVVGVEVGGAVRLGPLSGPPGDIYLFEEPLIRAYYPQFGGGGKGPTCRDLLSSEALSKLGAKLQGDRITTDLSTGVHLVVVKGCAPDAPLRKHSAAECGAGWTSDGGNLSVQEITLNGANRQDPTSLPVQVVNLSSQLDRLKADRDLVVSFGDVQPGAQTDAGVARQIVAINPALFGGAVPAEPARVSYAADETEVYDAVGFRVQLLAKGTSAADAGAAGTLLEASLARIQKQSSSRDVPPTYYAAASNYALLLLGDPEATLADGGRDEDERRNLHLLAVPVIDPKGDAGSEAGASEPPDGGSATPTP